MPKSFKEMVQAARDSGIPEITSEQLAAKMEKGEEFTILDVRDPEEWEKGTIPGAKTISRGKLEMKIGEEVPEEDREIVVYCGGGSRSMLASKTLRDMGYKNPVSLAGGYRGWKEFKGEA
jgi:rhodanese-related sulfurtransferase